MTPEQKRLAENEGLIPPWDKWGPYVSDRAWGTVREDYSENGDAWNYVTHDMAPYKTFRWGEDGIAGFCDRYQLLALSFAFWNGKDQILKERLFGLNPNEGNHGEDVKEFYYHLDATPTHSYMKFLYKYPQSAFPYKELIEENQKRSVQEKEYELDDTGVFKDNRYFDVFIEYAKESPENFVIRVEVFNRGPDDAEFHLLPQMVYRRRYIKKPKTCLHGLFNQKKKGHPCIVGCDEEADSIEVLDFDYRLGKRYLYGPKNSQHLFTNNETNTKKLFGKENRTQYVKDGFHRYLINNEKTAVNPRNQGTKAGIHCKETIPSGGSKVFHFAFLDHEEENPLDQVDHIVAMRKKEADAFFETVHPKDASQEEKHIQRSAIAGMIWSKQIYLFNVQRWAVGDHPRSKKLPKGREKIRNEHWKHLVSMRIMSMPDKWEYPWFAAWDLAFQTLTLALVDFKFAKDQLWYLLFDQFQHPNGQIPAYEWEFSELNPPVQAWAALQLYQMGVEKHNDHDMSFLQKCFHKLVMNFVWWVNKVDGKGNNVFEGGFLGLDNIAIIDRSTPVPGGGRLEQSDGTGWMGSFCLNLMRIALILSKSDKEYVSMAVKFFQHYVYISAALHHSKNREVQIWDDKDGFFYDVIAYPNGGHEQIKVRSLVGIIPLYAVDCITQEDLSRFPEFASSFHWFMNHRKDLTQHCVTKITVDGEDRWLLALANKKQIKRILSRVWDPNEFRSPFGLRSLSKFYQDHPFTMLDKTISYEPAEAISLLKGGNSNWRGPIWFPTTYLLLDALHRLHSILGDSFVVEVKDEEPVTTKEMAEQFAASLINIFLPNDSGKRPYAQASDLQSKDPHFKDHILFYEHFDGDTGRGLGASHQTGWSGLVANLIDRYRGRQSGEQ